MSTTGSLSFHELRTTDPEAARAFYARLVGARLEISPLPERARALGAPAHWLGHIRVDDLEASLRRFAERGAEPLGPRRELSDGVVAGVRDPQGAILALTTRAAASPADTFVWSELHTTDRERALAVYAEVFGWRATGTIDVGPPVGVYETFAWPGAETSVGGMADTARQPHIHVHWLFYLKVADLDAALAQVRAGGGEVIDGPKTIAGGHRTATCHDPQGAIFALRQPA